METIIWSAWIGGIAIGGYALFQHWLTSKQLGCSSSYISMCRSVDKRAYSDFDDKKESWRLWFFIGIPLGGLVAVLTSGAEWQLTLSMGDAYDALYPSNVWIKAGIVFIGGLLMGMGARMAGGCTSGHVISGIALLNPASLIAGALFFAGGLGIVQLMFLVAGW